MCLADCLVWGLRVGEEITREAKKARKVGGLTGSSSDDSGSESDASDNEESDYASSKNLSSGDDDDFNPFRDESSEDDEDGEFVSVLNGSWGVIPSGYLTWDIVVTNTFYPLWSKHMTQILVFAWWRARSLSVFWSVSSLMWDDLSFVQLF